MTFAVMAALILAAGCAEIENKSATNDVQHAIGFSNYAPKSLTKADDTYASSTTLINGKKFGVYAYATANAATFAADAIGTQFMNGVEVTYGTGGDSDATKNSYSPMRYWPSGDTPDKLTFWAYYPVYTPSNDGTEGSIVYTVPNGSDNGVGSYSFTTATTSPKMVDFMVSDVVNDKTYANTSNGVVPLTFRHQLAKIKVVFKTDNTDDCTAVVLTDAKVRNINTTGTLSTTYSAGATTTSWGSVATPANFEVLLSGADINNEVLKTSVVGGADLDLFLMIPQTMVAKDGTNPQNILVEWDVKTFDTAAHKTSNGATATAPSSDNGLLSITHNTAVLYLDECVTTDGGSTQADIDWEKNNFVTYTITIGPKPIRFTAKVTAWDSEVNGYFNVN